jgi:hypothetical protein
VKFNEPLLRSAACERKLRESGGGSELWSQLSQNHEAFTMVLDLEPIDRVLSVVTSKESYR